MAWATQACAWSSNSLVESSILGLPICCGSKMSLAYPISGTLDKKFRPHKWARERWLDYVASGQHSLKDIDDGEAWSKLKENL